jgi:hypothetical protein
VVNLILWGNMKRLTQSVLDEMPSKPNSQVLQVACVYGDFSNRVAAHAQLGIRFRIERVMMARSAVCPDQNAIDVVVRIAGLSGCVGLRERGGQRQAESGQTADLQKAAARQSFTIAGFVGKEVQHRQPPSG